MVTKSLREPWRFFLRHAGYATPPGRTVCALELARAEREGQQIGLRFRWEPDQDADLSWLEPGQTVETVEVCVAERRCERCGRWEVVASLGGITDATDDYRRVVEAELALEALATAEVAQ